MSAAPAGGVAGLCPAIEAGCPPPYFCPMPTPCGVFSSPSLLAVAPRSLPGSLPRKAPS